MFRDTVEGVVGDIEAVTGEGEVEVDTVTNLIGRGEGKDCTWCFLILLSYSKHCRGRGRGF